MIIYKYEIPIQSRFQIPLPYGSRILKFEEQKNQGLFIWVMHNKLQKPMTRTFGIRATGEEFDLFDNMDYVGTAQTSSGYVWHLFEFV